MQRAKGDQFCISKPQQVQGIRIVKVECLILGNSNSYRFTRCHDRRERIIGTILDGGNLVGQSKEFYAVTRLGKLFSEQSKPFSTYSTFSSRNQPQMTLWHQFLGKITQISQKRD